jgi:hypothetical protein
MWNRVLSFRDEIPPMADDPRHVEQNGLVLQWDGYSAQHGAQVLRPSTADTRICAGEITTNCQQPSPGRLFNI